MRRGLTLIELIFTIVIIAMVFTVIPKIVLSLNKADKFAIRQDAMFNGISMMKMISNMPWDANNTNSSDILHVTKGSFDCNRTTFLRIGSFIGGRTCEENLSANQIPNPTNFTDVDYSENNINDFNYKNVEVNTTQRKLYDLNITVSYIDDGIMNHNVKDLNLSNDRTDNNTSNLKRIRLNVYYAVDGRKYKQLTQFNYTSANIGQMILHKRVWQ